PVFRSQRPGIRVVRRDDRSAAVVIPGVQDMSDRVPNPVGWLRCPQFVEHQHLGLEYGRQYLQLGFANLCVIAVLDLLQQVAVVIEQASSASFGHQCLQNPHCQMGFANADRTGEQKPGSGRIHRIAFDKLSRPKMCRDKHPVRGGEIGLVAFQRAVLIAPRNMRAAQHSLGPAMYAANAILGKLPSVFLNHPQTGATAYRTNFTHSRASSMAVSESKCPLCESWIYLDNQIN